jgi:hypothetical protein
MSGKANKATIAIMLGSLLIIFGIHLSLNLPLSYAFGLSAGRASGEIEKEDPMDGDEKADLEKDEELLKLAIDMKLAEKDLKALIGGENNRARVFDKKLNKGMIDRDLLVSLMHDQEALLAKFDEKKAGIVDEDGEHTHPADDEKAVAIDAEDPGEEDIEEIEDIEDVNNIEDEVGVKELDDKDMMKIALKMNLLEKETKDLLMSDDSSISDFFDPMITKGFVDEPMLLRLVMMRKDLLDAYDKYHAE